MRTHRNDFMLYAEIVQLQDDLDSLVHETLPEEKWDQYWLLNRKINILQDARIERWERMDWEWAHDHGWFSKKDYMTIPELKKFSWKEAGKYVELSNNQTQR